MSSIDFFVPVVFGNEIKTVSQKALETVDEYFYLGNKFHVTVFTQDAINPRPSAVQSSYIRDRSWTNVAIKVCSYCNLIFPLLALLAKAILRSYLQISSIPMSHVESRGIHIPEQQHARRIEARIEVRLPTRAPHKPSSDIEARLPNDALQNIVSFLSHQDKRRFAEVALFGHHTLQHYNEPIAPFKREIATLPAKPLASNDFQRLLVGLVTSPCAGDPKHWAPLMDALMGHLAPETTVDDLLQRHANMADLLVRSEQPISADQLYQFCGYLGQKQLSERRPWIGYRALEQYLLKPQLNSEGVNKALKEYLTRQAKNLIGAAGYRLELLNNRHLLYQEADIDPRQWFGFNVEKKRSLWVKQGAQNNEIAPIPEILSEVLATHLQSLRSGKPFIVSMIGRTEARLPRNFTLKLAHRITNVGIFLEHNNTINSEELEQPHYARPLHTLEIDEREALAAQHYPNAIAAKTQLML